MNQVKQISPPYQLLLLLPPSTSQTRLPNRKACLSPNIETIIQMGRQDQIPMQTDIITGVTVRADFAGGDLPERGAVVWVPEQHDTVDEVGRCSGDHVSGVVGDLGALAVS